MYIELSDWIHNARALLLLGAFAGFAWALVSSRRQAQRANEQLAARLDAALGEIRKLSGQLVTLGDTIESVGSRVREAAVQRPAPVAAPASPPFKTRGYETAIRLARSGASVEEIVASCGTTRAEAKLLRRLHECGDPRRADAEAVKIA